MRRAVAVLVVFAVVFTVGGGSASGASGPAPSESERNARRAFQDAETQFKAGHFVEALERYQAGYDELPLPGFLINIAQCQRRLGKLPQARATYQKFVMVAPDSPHVPEVRALIAELDKLITDLDGHEAVAVQPTGAQPTAALAIPALAAAVPTESPAALLSTPAATPTTVDRPPHRRRWLWTVATAAVVGVGATAALVALSPGSVTIREGTLATLRR